MAKLRGKAKAAFLRRMKRGRAKARRASTGEKRKKSKPRRAKAAATKRPRKKRRTAAQRAATKKMIAANRRRRSGGGGSKRKRATGGTTTMAKKKRKSSKPAHRRRRRARGRRRAVTITGFRKVRLSNPSVGGMIAPAVAGLAGGAAVGLVVTKLLGDKSAGLRSLATVAVGLLGAVFLRKRPAIADAWSGAAIGSLGYTFAVNATGGVVATNKPDALALTAKIPDAKTDTSKSSGTQGMGVLLPMNRAVRPAVPGMGMGVLYNNAAARSLTGMGSASPLRTQVNPRALLG